MLLIDALNDSATDLIKKRNLSSDDRTRVWGALAEIYPEVPEVMKGEMNRRGLRVADNAVLSFTIEKIREIPSVREFAPLRDTVNNAASKVLPSSYLVEPRVHLSQERISTT